MRKGEIICFIIILLVLLSIVVVIAYKESTKTIKENEIFIEGCESRGGAIRHVGVGWYNCFGYDEDNFQFQWRIDDNGRWYKTK